MNDRTSAQTLVKQIGREYADLCHSKAQTPDWRNGAAHLLISAAQYAYRESYDAATARLDAMVAERLAQIGSTTNP